MKTKILTLLVAMLLFTTLTACDSSKKDNKSGTTANSVTTVEPVVTATSETVDSTEIEDDFIAVAKEMFMQYHNNEENFNELLRAIKEYSVFDEKTWIGDSSYCIQVVNQVALDGASGYMMKTNYSEDKNGRNFNEYVNEQANTYGSVSEVTTKTINSLEIAHFTSEFRYDVYFDQNYDYYYNEFYIIDDLKDDKFLTVVFQYANEKKNNDNSANPKQMTSDHSSYFLCTAEAIQTIQEVEKQEIEIYDFDNNESTGIAFNTLVNIDSRGVYKYEKNVPIEGSDNYNVISGYAFSKDRSELLATGLNESSVYEVDPFSDFSMYISVLSVNDGKEDLTLLESAQEELQHNSYGDETTTTLEEININGLNGYLVKESSIFENTDHDIQYTIYQTYYVYFFEHNNRKIEISLRIDYSNETIGKTIESKKDVLMNSIHIIEK